jgi:hypothetical protein
MTKLKQGMLGAEAIEADSRWYVVQMDDVRATAVPDYESVKPMLRRKLEARERAAESLAKICSRRQRWSEYADCELRAMLSFELVGLSP